jgi:hypothetical protein
MMDPNDSQNLAVSRSGACFRILFRLAELMGVLEKQSLLLFGWLLLASPVAMEAQFYYTTNDGTITITGYAGTNGVVVIPDTINGLSVTSIGEGAFFYQRTSLTSVIIPNSVTSIGADAFSGCTNLTNVTIPNSVTGIPWDAFYGCTSLTSVIIPNSVTGIGSWAFGYCTSLTNVTIPNSVTSIGWRTFSGCHSLTSVTIPNSVTIIEAGAFSGCSSLTSVTIPNSVTSIGTSAFSYCANLTAISVEPNHPVYSSVSGVLFDRSQTTLIEYPSGKVGSYSIPNSVTNIADAAFGGCASLTSVIIPNSVTSIGYAAFYGCSSLTSVTIPNSVTAIGANAFYGCTSLTRVYFQGDAPSHGADVFYQSNPTLYYLPGTVGWVPTFAGRPTATWSLPYPLILNSSLGVRSNQFGFTISWATNLSVVVEATSDLKNLNWFSIQTNALNNGVANFTDPQWMNYPSRFYRVRSQ